MSDEAQRMAAAAVGYVREWGGAGGLRRVLVRIESIADVHYLLLGRTAPRYRGTELSEVWRVDCVDIPRTARQLFAALARDDGFDPRAGAEIITLSEAPWPDPPTSEQLQQRARGAEAVARGEVTVTYGGSYTPAPGGTRPAEH